MVCNPVRPITIYDLAGRLDSAYPNAMTLRNVQEFFSGMFPFNPDIFTNDEYLISYVTVRENSAREIENEKRLIVAIFPFRSLPHQLL